LRDFGPRSLQRSSDRWLPGRHETFPIAFYVKDEADDLSSEGRRLIAQLVAAIKAEP